MMRLVQQVMSIMESFKSWRPPGLCYKVPRWSCSRIQHIQWAPQTWGHLKHLAGSLLPHCTPNCPTPGRTRSSPSSWWAHCNLQLQHTHTDPCVTWAKRLTMFFWKWLHTVWDLSAGFGCIYLFFLVFSCPRLHICSCEGWWLPLLSNLSPESLLSMVSIVTIWILHFRCVDEWSPRAWSHDSEHGAEITAKFASTAH